MNHFYFIFRHAFDDVLGITDGDSRNEEKLSSSTQRGSKLILSCSYLKDYWKKNKKEYEGFKINADKA